jgi:hypothetical protein
VLAIVLVVVAGLVVFAIAAGVVGRETWRLDASSPRPVFDEDEAVSWVAERLPFEVSAELSHEDVWRMMAIALDHLPVAGQEATVDAESETVRLVLGTPDSATRGWTEAQVRAVLGLELAYLQIIGAADGGAG